MAQKFKTNEESMFEPVTDEIDDKPPFVVKEEPPTVLGSPAGLQIIDVAPIDGHKILVSRDGETFHEAFYKKTRAFVKTAWVPTGKWCDPATKVYLGFEPRFWKEAD